MATLLPEAIQGLLDAINEYKGTDLWSDVLNHSTNPRDKDLTSTFCSSDTADFIALDDDGIAWLFVANDQTGNWTVQEVGKPEYAFDSDMLGADEIDPIEFKDSLQYSLEGLDVRFERNGVAPQISPWVVHFESKMQQVWAEALSDFDGN